MKTTCFVLLLLIGANAWASIMTWPLRRHIEADVDRLVQAAIEVARERIQARIDRLRGKVQT